jgi:hypothetical protein
MDSLLAALDAVSTKAQTPAAKPLRYQRLPSRLRSKDAHVPAKRKLVSEIHDVGVTSRVAAVNASSNNALFGLLLAPEVREGPSPEFALFKAAFV